MWSLFISMGMTITPPSKGGSQHYTPLRGGGSSNAYWCGITPPIWLFMRKMVNLSLWVITKHFKGEIIKHFSGGDYTIISPSEGKGVENCAILQWRGDHENVQWLSPNICNLPLQVNNDHSLIASSLLLDRWSISILLSFKW